MSYAKVSLFRDPWGCTEAWWTFSATRRYHGEPWANSYSNLSAAFRLLAYKRSSDNLVEYCRVCATYARKCVNRSSWAAWYTCGDEFVNVPAMKDTMRIHEASASRYSLDAPHFCTARTGAEKVAEPVTMDTHSLSERRQPSCWWTWWMTNFGSFTPSLASLGSAVT